MASAKVTVTPKASKVERTEMVIIGGGICGLIAARNCYDRNLPFKLIEKNPSLGGNWYSLANSYSHLQVCSLPHYVHSVEIASVMLRWVALSLVMFDCIPISTCCALGTHHIWRPPLQAYEPNYRWDDDYKLNTDPLTKNSGAAVSCDP
jgi:hypothetical protein